MIQRNLLLHFALFAVILCLFAAPASGQTLDATGNWSTGITDISWTVSYDPSSDPNLVYYSYTFNYSAGHDPSYFIFEVSDGITSGAFSDVQVNSSTATFEVDWFTPDRDNTGGQYQTMPETIYGIKIDNIDACAPGEPCDNSVTLSFYSTQLPTWGDIYARCGVRPYHADPNDPNYPTEWNSAWNAGFTNPDGNDSTADDLDPIVMAGSGSVSDHLLVPDTTAAGSGYEAFTYSGSLTVVPEPISSTLFVIGSAILGFRRFKRRKIV